MTLIRLRCNTVLFTLLGKYISAGRCSIYSTAFAVYIQSLMQYIFIFKGYVLAEAGIPIF